MTDEIAIEKALLLGQVRAPDVIHDDGPGYFNVVWIYDGQQRPARLTLAWSEGDSRTTRWGSWRLHRRHGDTKTIIKGFPAVLEALSDPAFRKRYGIDPEK